MSQEDQKEKEQKNQVWKKWWFWAIVAVIAIAWIVNFANNDESQPTATNQQEEQGQEQVEEEQQEPEQQVAWPDVELNEESVKEALKSVNDAAVVQIDDDTLKKIEIVDNTGTQDQQDKIVNVYVDPGIVWDETDYARKMANSIVAYSELLFQHPDVSMLRLWGSTTFVDQYGNEKEETAVRIEWDRETAEKVNYSNFKNIVISDYGRAYEIASNYYIHPGLYKNLKEFELPAQGGK